MILMKIASYWLIPFYVEYLGLCGTLVDAFAVIVLIEL